MTQEGIGASSPVEIRRSISNEVVSLADGPIELRLATHRLQVVDPLRDIGKDAGRIVNEYIGCFVVDPLTFGDHVGYKALRDGESITLGRTTSYDSHRFRFVETVSREHVRLQRDGNDIRITDLDSTNGTFLIEPPADETDEETVADTAPMVEIAEAPTAFRMAGDSVASAYHPKANEDAYFIDEQHRSLGVFDGLGGHAGSGAASDLAAATVERFLGEVPADAPRSIAELAIREALETAHQAILGENQPGIATTAIIAKVFETQPGAPYAMVGSAGDSRAYLIRSGKIEHVTLDHVFTGLSTSQRLGLQETLAQATDLSRLTDKERAMFMSRNVIDSCLGDKPGNSPTISVSALELRAGDQLLLTSDGIHDNLTNDEIEEIVAYTTDPDTVIRNLMDAAKARSLDERHPRHKPDDMTAAVLSC